MKEIKWTKKNILIWSSLTVFALLLYIWGSRGTENNMKSILDDCGYTVGTVKIFFIESSKLLVKHANIQLFLKMKSSRIKKFSKNSQILCADW